MSTPIISNPDPCPACEGRGYDKVKRGQFVVREMCVVCSGTGKRPIQSGIAASRRANRINAIIRGQADHAPRSTHRKTDEQSLSGGDRDD